MAGLSSLRNVMHAMLGPTQPDTWGEILGTGFMRFRSSCGISGLAREIDGALHLLVVETINPGQGQFRSFITCAKVNYRAIYVWQVWNPWLPAVLERYGFSEASMILDGELLTGYVWQA